MTELRYPEIEQQAVNALPELRPAAERYWAEEGPPGEDCGPHIFFGDVVDTYVKLLLARSPSSRRDALLRRVFAFVESMLGSKDEHVRDLAAIEIYEGRAPWWTARAQRFLGPLGIEALDSFQTEWRSLADPKALPSANDLSDGYGVRQIVANELREDGVGVDDVPGTTRQERRVSGIVPPRGTGDACRPRSAGTLAYLACVVACGSTLMPYWIFMVQDSPAITSAIDQRLSAVVSALAFAGIALAISLAAWRNVATWLRVFFGACVLTNLFTIFFEIGPRVAAATGR